MSIDRCADCGRFVDTDDEPEAYIDAPGFGGAPETICCCEPCRDKREAEADKRDAALSAAEDRGCLCHPRTAGPTDIDPPEGRTLNRDCPAHGVDPDQAREDKADG